MFLVFFLGITSSYFLSQFHFRGKRLLETLLTLPLVLPPTVLGYYLILIFGRKSYIGGLIETIFGNSITFTWIAAAMASFTVSLPLMIKTVTATMKQIDPHLIQTSYLLGHSHMTTATKVILPLAKNGIVAGLILAFARGLGEFGATLMLAGNIPGKTTTMPLAIYNFTSSGDYTSAHVLALFLTLFSLTFLYLSNFLLKEKRDW